MEASMEWSSRQGNRPPPYRCWTRSRIPHCAPLWTGLLQWYPWPFYKCPANSVRANWDLYPLPANKAGSLILCTTTLCHKGAWVNSKVFRCSHSHRWYMDHRDPPSNRSYGWCRPRNPYSAWPLCDRLHYNLPQRSCFQYPFWWCRVTFLRSARPAGHAYPSLLFAWLENLSASCNDRKGLWWPVPWRGEYPAFRSRTADLHKTQIARVLPCLLYFCEKHLDFPRSPISLFQKKNGRNVWIPWMTYPSNTNRPLVH